MKKVAHKLLAVLLCVLVLCGLLGTASGSSGVYFMAVNDTVVEMTSDNMPIVVGGTLYVPYIMLSSRDTGINLGVTAQYSATRRTVLVSGGREGVIFNPQSNSCQDLNGNPLPARAVVRNAMVYIPIAWVCSYFGSISYTTTRTTYGTLVRVTSSSVILTDAEFVDAAASMLRDNYNRYLSSVSAPQPSQPNGSPSPSVQPADGPVVYLAFRMGERVEEMARLLENSMQRGLFLLTAEQLAQEDDLVRRLIGAGHLVGLEVTGSTLEEWAAQLREGSRLLADVARTALTIVYIPDAEGEMRREAEELGYALWPAAVQAERSVSAADLLRGLDRDAPNYVEAVCDDEGLALMTDAMGSLAGAGYRLRQAVAPAL